MADGGLTYGSGMSEQDGRVAVVTGAAVGLGAGFAEALAGLGMNLSLCDVRSEVHDVAAGLAARHGIEARAFTADVSHPADAFGVVDATIDALGAIDVLVANAGTNRPSNAFGTLDDALEAYEANVMTNTAGVFYFGRAVIPHLVERGRGDIVVICTDHVYTEPRRPTGGGPDMDLYDASKWALNGFTTAWAEALTGTGVRVNALCMGATDSNMLRTWVGGDPSPEMIASWKTPTEVAGVLVELLAEGPAGRTGTNVPIWRDEPAVLPAASDDWSDRLGRMKAAVGGRLAGGRVSLEGRVAVVTGAARGLGEAYAAALRSEGVGVIGCDVCDGDQVEMVADVGTRRGVEKVVAAALDRFGGVDLLVNNAARWATTPITDPRDKAVADFDRIMDANLKGPLMLQRATLGSMLERGVGDVVNVSADLVLPPGPISPGCDLFAASKWALCGLTQAWALKLVDTPVRVNAIAVGPTDTPGQRAAHDGRLPAGTVAAWMTPAEQAARLVDLLREGPGGRTGETIASGPGQPSGLPPITRRGDPL